jgi:phosphoserine aminotransferase
MFSGRGDKAQYVDGGFWSDRAYQEGTKYCQAIKIAQTYVCPSTGKLRYPDVSQWCVFHFSQNSLFICWPLYTTTVKCASVDAVRTAIKK